MKSNDKFKLFKHQSLIVAISVFGIVMTFFTGSFAIFSSTSSSASKAQEYNYLKSGVLEISYVDLGNGYGDILSLNGAYPISDSEAEDLTPHRFSITNTGDVPIDYRIRILYDEAIIKEDGCSGNLLLQSFVKYKFDNETIESSEDENNSNSANYLSSKESVDYTIYKGYGLMPNSSDIHNIRIWVAEDAPNNVLGKHFHGKLVVEAIQGGLTETKEYTIGNSVTLVDNSTWHVLENSSSTETTIKLLADNNVNTESIAFDTSNNRLTSNNSYCVTPATGCNIYSKNNSTVIKDSTIKEWLEGTYLPSLKSALTTNGGTIEDLEVSLPSMEELASADYQTFNQTQVNFNTSWITSSSYWTKTASTINSSYVWKIDGNLNNSQLENASASLDIRPVIVVSKANIK